MYCNCRELIPGDSGCIVYKVCSNGEHRPLGMYVGIVDFSRVFGSHYYQALILDQALRDIATNYQHITDIEVVG